MAKDLDNARVYGDIDSAVWVGPKGTTMPTAPTTAPGAAFKELGWLGEDGLTETREQDTEKKRAWQGGVTVRIVRSNDARMFKFVCLETNAITVGLTRPGSTPATVSGVTHTPVKAFTGSDIRAWIIDTIDGSVNTRKCIPTGEVTEVGDIVAVNTEITAMEMTVECYPDSDGVLYDEYTDDPAQAVT